jgi:hypothetical protein
MKNAKPWEYRTAMCLSYLTIGGEVREVLERVGNDNRGAQPYTNTFFLERYMAHTDWHLASAASMCASGSKCKHGGGRLRRGYNIMYGRPPDR